MRTVKLDASMYQQYDADASLDVPAEGYAGWRRDALEIDLDHTAVVVMHAWETGTRERYPGWYRAVEYIPRSKRILSDVFPGLLAAVRRGGVHLFHVVGGGHYYQSYPGYLRATSLAGSELPTPQILPDLSLQRLHQYRAQHIFVGAHNEADVARGFQQLGFPAEAQPLGDEGIAESAGQLFALCQETSVSHLIYAGFAINWCLLMSPGGMLDMSRRGVMCSVLRQAVTAVENKESARSEGHKEEALWRVALAFGFVFDVDDFIRAIA